MQVRIHEQQFWDVQKNETIMFKFLSPGSGSWGRVRGVGWGGGEVTFMAL